MPQNALGRAELLPHDGDAAIGNEAAVLLAGFDSGLPALSDGERDLALGADSRHGGVLSCWAMRVNARRAPYSEAIGREA